jgi:hypothetical protein
MHKQQPRENKDKVKYWIISHHFYKTSHVSMETVKRIDRFRNSNSKEIFCTSDGKYDLIVDHLLGNAFLLFDCSKDRFRTPDPHTSLQNEQSYTYMQNYFNIVPSFGNIWQIERWITLKARARIRNKAIQDKEACCLDSRITRN